VVYTTVKECDVVGVMLLTAYKWSWLLIVVVYVTLASPLRYLWVFHVQELLGVDVKHLIDALTVNVSYAHGEVVRRHWNKKSSSGTNSCRLHPPPITTPLNLLRLGHVQIYRPHDLLPWWVLN